VIVVDASVVANAVGDDSALGTAARTALRTDPDIWAPDLVDVEAMSTLRRRWRAGMLTADQLEQAADDLRMLPIVRRPMIGLMRRAFELRDNVTPYDAAYVALAEGLGCTLVTGDRRLANAPSLRCTVEVITV
jgi:predicted nucleic acid-binding protein